MKMLFSDIDEPITPIPGLMYRPSYLDKDEERVLVEEIDAMPWNTDWRRRRQPYGAGYDNTGEAAPIPAWGRSLADRLFKEGLTDRPFDQMLVNEYLSGQGIAAHRDYAPFGRIVISISLLSPAIMDFRCVKTGVKESLLLEPRSLLMLADEARYEWEHGIAPRKRDVWQGGIIRRARRLSITFRYRNAPAAMG